MKINVQQLVRAIILFLFAFFIYRLHHSGEILQLINPKYETLSMIGATIFFVLSIVQLFRIFSVSSNHIHCEHTDHRHDHGDKPINIKKVISYLIILFPLATGFLLPFATLDASIAKNKGATLSLRNQGEREVESAPLPTNDPNQIDPNVYKNKVSKEEYEWIQQDLFHQPHLKMEDTLYALIYQEVTQNINMFNGRKITLNGFVYREQDFASNQLVIGRFLITHCIADAGLIGFLAEFDQEMTVSEDTWMEVTGTIRLTEYQCTSIPLLEIEEYQTIDQPEQPYVYPLNIQVLGGG